MSERSSRYVNARINDYLTALHRDPSRSPFRGRRTEKQVRASLAACEEKLAGNSVSPLQRLNLVQQRMDLEAILAAPVEADPMPGLEELFVELAAGYAERHNISRAAFREVGVPAGVLNRAGIK